jgi:phosphatidylglycerophosphate synthase
MTRPSARLTSVAALLVGAGLLFVALKGVDLQSVRQLSRLFGIGLPLALLPGAAWHLLRTVAWRRCFPSDVTVPLATMFRVRISAEAFSYLTISGVTGEPIKVALLARRVPPAVSAAAIAVERVAYLVVTAAMVAICAAIAAISLPMTPAWTRVYAWTAVLALATAVIPIVFALRDRTATPQAAADAGAQPHTRVRRFLLEFARQFRVLARSDGRRLAVLVGLEAAAFLMMALEVLAALRLTGTPISLIGAVAIESFTRIASIASGFIPANIGALEVSNVAAAAAVHAAGGGVALALLRRIRGLGWCAAGLLLYPRAGRRDGESVATSTRETPAAARTLVSLQCGDSDALVREPLGGMPIGERVGRAAVRAGYARLLVWTPHHATEWRAAVAPLSARLEVVATSDPVVWRDQWTGIAPCAQVAVIGPGVVASPQQLASASTFVRAADLAEPDAAAARMLCTERLAPRRHDDVANESTGLATRILTRSDLADAERELRASIFKPTDGLLARFNRRLSIPISVALIRLTRFSANAMSVLVIALGLYAGWLFSRGTYTAGVVAALLSWAASVLDGCDGELARLQFKESAFGCWVDTLGDYTYYIAVFAGLTVGAVRQTGSPVFWWCGVALSIGVLSTLALLILLRWRATGGRPERLRSRTTAHFVGTGKRWARFVAWLAPCATRATMPYGIVLFAIAGVLPAVVVLATIGANIYWISLAREFRQLVSEPLEATVWTPAERGGRPDRSAAAGW